MLILRGNLSLFIFFIYLEVCTQLNCSQNNLFTRTFCPADLCQGLPKDDVIEEQIDIYQKN